MTPVTIEGPGRRLAGLLQGDPAARQAVAICHGMLSSMRSIKHAELAARLAARGFRVLRFDFATRGRSRLLNLELDHTRITYTDQAADLAAAVAYLDSPERLSLVGSSMGGSVCLLHAARHPVAGVVTFASPAFPARPRPPHFPASLLEEWRRRGHLTVAGNRISSAYLDDAERLNLPAAAAALRCPLLLLHGTADEVVPFSDAQAFAGAAPCATLHPIAGADHRFNRPEHREQLLAAAVAFIEKLRDNPIAGTPEVR